MHLQTWRISLSNGDCQILGNGFEMPFNFVVATPWGLLGENEKSEFALMDLKHNQLKNLSVEKNRLIIAKKQFLKSPEMLFMADSMLYMVNLKLNKLDSLILSQSDFQDSNKQIYSSGQTFFSSSTMTYFSLAFIMLAAAGGFFYLKTRSSSKKDFAQSNSFDVTIEGKVQKQGIEYPFTDLELQLLALLDSKHGQDTGVTIEELNNHLGLKFKNESVQKKVRSETLNQLNQKLRLLLSLEQEVIVKHRAESDKRSFTYFLAADSRDLVREKFLA